MQFIHVCTYDTWNDQNKQINNVYNPLIGDQVVYVIEPSTISLLTQGLWGQACFRQGVLDSSFNLQGLPVLLSMVPNKYFFPIKTEGHDTAEKFKWNQKQNPLKIVFNVEISTTMYYINMESTLSEL